MPGRRDENEGLSLRMAMDHDSLGEERALITKSLQGDREAFGILIERYADTVLTVATRMVGNGADAQDLAQDTFLKAYTALPSFRQESKFSTWLYQIAMNKCRDWLRSKARKREESTDADEDSENFTPRVELQAEGDPEQEVSRKQLASHMEGAIQDLPELYREAFILKHVEGLDYEEMATILNVNRDTLKMRVYKARVQLCRTLAWMKE